jgi:hypothetical protein
MSDDKYLDLDTLAANAEAVPDEPVEAEDYQPFSITPIGRYISLSRKITGRQRDDGHFAFEVEFTGGIASEDDPSRVFEKGNYPLKDRRVSTKPFQDFDRGVTSGAAKYLRAFGVKTGGVRAGEIPSLMSATQVEPVGVYVGREVRAQKNEDGTYERPMLIAGPSGKYDTLVYSVDPGTKWYPAFKTKHFKGEGGKQLNSVTDANGRVWQGQPVVEGYFQIK